MVSLAAADMVAAWALRGMLRGRCRPAVRHIAVADDLVVVLLQDACRLTGAR
jgi:hypothetical protein